MTLAPPRTVLFGIGSGMAVAGVFYHLTKNMKVFGGETPRTLSKEYQDAHDEWKNAVPRKAAPPVMINPSRPGFIEMARKNVE